MKINGWDIKTKLNFPHLDDKCNAAKNEANCEIKPYLNFL